MSNEDLEKTVADLVAKNLAESLKKTEATSNREPTVYVNDEASKLRQLVDNLLQSPPVFKRGDAVRWKKGLKNKKYPKEDQVAVVIQQLDEPIIQGERDSGSPYFREPLDLKLGVLDDDGDLMVFHYDKQRFERVP